MKRCGMGIIVILFLALITNFLVEFISLEQEKLSFFKTILVAGHVILTRPIQWLSTGWIFIFLILLISVINRVWVVILAAFSIIGSVLVALYFKVHLRAETIVFSDIYELKSLSTLIKMIDFDKSIVIGVATLLIGVIFIKTKVKGLSFKTDFFLSKKKRFFVLFASGAVVLAPFVVPQNSMQEFYKMAGKRQLDYSSVADAGWNGALVVFFCSLNGQTIEAPEDYSLAKLNVIREKYTNLAKKINENRYSDFRGQTVIYLLSESLSNPEDVPGLKADKKNLANMEHLKKEAVFSGKMISSGDGGGTANVEYMTLTGVPLTLFSTSVTTPYVQLPDVVNEMPSILDYFDNKVTIHPSNSFMYNRVNVYKKMGMQQFVTADFEGNQKIKYRKKLGASDYIRDSEAYKELLSRISSNTTESQFLQLLTMQNHLPYEDSKSDFEKLAETVPNLKRSDFNQINRYLNQIRETDKQTGLLMENLDKLSRPITVVFYGDHWPSVYSFVDRSKNPVRTHTTDFFIWQNRAANQNRVANKENNRKFVSPTDFNSLMLESTGSKVSPYFALQQKLATEVPAIANYTRTGNGRLKFVDNDGKEMLEKNLTKQQQDYISDMRSVMFDLCEGEGYLSTKGFFKPDF